jgi:hypothetical protein
MNTLEKYCMYKICQQGMQLNGTFSFNKNLIYYMILNTPNYYSSTHISYPLLIPMCFQLHPCTPQSSTKIHLCINVGFCYTLKSTSIFTNLSLWTYSTTSVCTNSTTIPIILCNYFKIQTRC